MKRLLLLLCLSAAVRPAAAQTAVSGFVRSLPERLARPLDDTLVVLRDLELLAPRRVMQSFDVVSDSTIYISQLGAFENHVPGRTRSHEVYVFEVRPGCDTMPRMTLRYFGHGANIAVEECGGTRYVWIDSNATRVGGEYWQSCTVSRVPFRAGSCCDHDGGETFYFDDGCFNLLPAVDRAHDLLSISYRKADGTHGFRHFRLSEALALPDTVLRVVRTWGGERSGECERTEERAIRCRDLRRLTPVGGFLIPPATFAVIPSRASTSTAAAVISSKGPATATNRPTAPPMHASPSPRSTAGSSIGVFPSGPTPISKDFVRWG